MNIPSDKKTLYFRHKDYFNNEWCLIFKSGSFIKFLDSDTVEHLDYILTSCEWKDLYEKQQS